MIGHIIGVYSRKLRVVKANTIQAVPKGVPDKGAGPPYHPTPVPDKELYIYIYDTYIYIYIIHNIYIYIYII